MLIRVLQFLPEAEALQQLKQHVEKLNLLQKKILQTRSRNSYLSYFIYYFMLCYFR